MKAVFRRRRRIEAQLAPKPNAVAQRAVEVLRERRRRRAEASGEHFDELGRGRATPPPGGYLSAAETLQARCLGRERVAAAPK
jgi:hypothetical protein